MKPLLARQRIESPRPSSSRREHVSVCIPACVLQVASGRTQALPPTPPPPLPPAAPPTASGTKGCLACVCMYVCNQEPWFTCRSYWVCIRVWCYWRYAKQHRRCMTEARFFLILKTCIYSYRWNKVKYKFIRVF